MISPGLRIGRYEIGARLGKGGFGVVHLARDVDLDRAIAIKVLKPEYLTRPQIVQRFIKEARAAAKIGHAGIVTVFECGQIQGTGTRADGNAYIAMELLVGESLADRIANNGRMSNVVAITITRQLAAALAAAHAAGIIHRDLKPDNVFLVPDAAVHGGERVKVLDFGVAKLMDSSEDGVNTHSQMMLGTPKYMSPEQARAASKVDHRSDIYTLGCMLFEMLTGRSPFSGDSGEQLIAHQKTPPPSARALVPTVPESIDRLIRRMLSKSPEERPQSMTAVVDALAETTDEPDTLVRSPISAARTSAEITTVAENVKPPSQPTARVPLLFAVGLAAFVLAGIIVMITMKSGSKPSAVAKVAPDAPTPPDAAVVVTAPIIIDAHEVAPSPKDVLERLKFRCAEANANRKWGDLIACAEEMRKHDQTMGDKLYAAGHAEQKAEAQMRVLEAALKEGNLKKARAALDAIGEESVFTREAKEKWEPARKQAVADLVAAAKKSITRDCKNYEQLMRQSAASLPKDIVESAKDQVGCTKEAGSKRPEKIDDTCNAEVLFQKAMDAFPTPPDHGFRLFEAAFKCKPEGNTLRFAFVSACKSKNAAKAKFYFKKLSTSVRESTLTFCVSNGITYDVLSAP